MIYDCFPFSNELDLLEIRLNELESLVDIFVLVESPLSFAGIAKPLYFELNKDRFKKFPIHHYIAANHPNTSNPWVRDRWQRNQIGEALKELKPKKNDLIIVSDVDEIPRPSAILKTVADIKPSIYYRFMNNLYYYRLNGYIGQIGGSGLCLYADFTNGHDIRTRSEGVVMLQDAGWHFSYLGNPDFIQNKIRNASHQELNLSKFTDEIAIKRKINNGLDLFDRDQKIVYVPIDDTFPDYVQANIEELKVRDLIR